MCAVAVPPHGVRGVKKHELITSVPADLIFEEINVLLLDLVRSNLESFAHHAQALLQTHDEMQQSAHAAVQK